MKLPIQEIDIIYISFDEPKKEEFWEIISENIPWAQRVDGVEGFDSAHKAAAELSDTEYFMTIDGDNIPDYSILDEELDIKDENTVFSFNAVNNVNGLCYGNGGLKIWPKKVVLNMKTHENSISDRSKVDFCWDVFYLQMNNVYSTSYHNQSPYQAFRSGFREGVKMSLDNGAKLNEKNFLKKIYHKNLERLLIWASVGADVENGLWSIFGSRLGCSYVLKDCFQIENIANYNFLNQFWETEIKDIDLKEENYLLGSYLRSLGIEVAELDEISSKLIKKVMQRPHKSDIMMTEKVSENGNI